MKKVEKFDEFLTLCTVQGGKFFDFGFFHWNGETMQLLKKTGENEEKNFV